VYGVALSVNACLRAGTRVDVAWMVAADGIVAWDPAEALALTPGGGRVGTLLGGAVDGVLTDEAGKQRSRGRLVDAHIGDVEALIAGLPGPGDVRCLLVPARALPAELWPLLTARAAVCLVSRLDGSEVVETSLFTADSIAGAPAAASGLFGRRASAATVTGDEVVTVLWPVPTLVLVGGGPIVAALGDAAALLGWRVETATDIPTATGLIAGLASIDHVVVAAHEDELAGRALAAALDSDVGYIGAVGSRRMQDARAAWLAHRGVTDLSRLHGPAGLDIGADTPPEIAVAILAEALAAVHSKA
jgi:xanthine dehydrogenase accessory factor